MNKSQQQNFLFQMKQKIKQASIQGVTKGYYAGLQTVVNLADQGWDLNKIVEFCEKQIYNKTDVEKIAEKMYLEKEKKND